MSTTTVVSKVATVAVPVVDQEKALELYVDKLGFEKRTDISMGNGYRWIEVAPPGAETTIAIPPPSGKAGEKDTRISLQTDDIDALHAELRSRGVDVDDEVTRFGDRVPPMFWFRDAEQNTLMVIERR